MGSPKVIMIVQIVFFGLFPGRIAGNVEADAIRFQIQNIMDQRLVSPSVMQRSGHVQISIQNYQNRTLETQLTGAKIFGGE